MFDISQHEINVKCPECKSLNTARLQQLQNQETIKCINIGCGKNIHLVDKDGSVRKSVSDINDALSGIKNTIKKFNK